jgi:hypothetical protein
MISKFDSIQGMFAEIASKLVKPANVYVIGGAALMHYGSKESTKDIDLVMKMQEEYEAIRNALLALGFESKLAPLTHQNFTMADRLVKDDFLLDLFNKVICKTLQLTERMEGRAIKTNQIGNLSVNMCSKEDIFLLKSITSRHGDKDDCIRLVKQGLRWDIILDELTKQIQEHGKEIWITYVHERLEELAEEGLTIPILKQTQALTEIYHEKIFLEK